jgi:hypothetical protein
MLAITTPLRADAGSIPALVDALTGAGLEDGGFGHPGEVIAAAGRLEYLRLAGSSRRKLLAPGGLPACLLEGWAASRVPFAFALWAEYGEAHVAIGAQTGVAETWARSVRAAIGGAGPIPCRYPAAGCGTACCFGCLAGAPRAARSGQIETAGAVGVADLLLDALGGARFLYLVFATPEPPDVIREGLRAVRSAAEQADRVHLHLGQQSNVDRAALRARELLDAAARRLDAGLAGALWRVSALVASDRIETTRLALGVLSGAVRDPGGAAPMPVRAVLCAREGAGRPVHANLLAASEVATLCPLPQRDRAGFAIAEEADFDVDDAGRMGDVVLGSVVDRSGVTARKLRIAKTSLCRHTLVCGHTGFGKSTTVRTILSALAEHRVPFLVLEPAKAEYRALGASVADLWACRVGSPPHDGEVPFLLNPFELPAGFPLHTHIDLLKQAFIASFGLVPPTPYLLETAIYRAYESRGWNIATGEHPNGRDPLAFPTLSDLLLMIDPVVDAAGYGSEISQNLRGALKTRVGNLCIGPKGMALDTRERIPDELLFGRPVVIELKDLGSDEEKALVMGLVITRLYELRESGGTLAGGDELRHLLVIEEAHRLLKRTSERSAEDGNMAHQAVEAFANVIAEVRAYGQGVLIVEQIPSKLAPDVVKQTALKVVHHLAPKADRDEVGDAMVLEEAQKRALALLPIGEAVVHSETMDGAMRIRVAAAAPPPAAAAQRPASGFPAALASRVELVRRRARLADVLRDDDVRHAADRIILASCCGSDLSSHVESLCLEVHRRLPGSPEARSSATPEASDLAVRDALLRVGLHYRWTSEQLDVASQAARVLPTNRIGPAFAGIHRASHLRDPGCRECPDPCLFGWIAERLSADSAFRDDVADIERLETSAWRGALEEAAIDAFARSLGWTDGLPPGALHYAVRRVLRAAGLRRAAVEAVLRLMRPARA